jgi:glutamine cyclotransferase
MTRGTRTPLAILLAAALVALTGCSGDASDAPNTDAATQSPARPLAVEATLRIPAAGTIVTAHDRLWVISGGKTVVTQVDPDTNSITRHVKVPHPVAYGTVAYGSLWLVSYGDNALIQVDADSGKVLRTLDSSPQLPLQGPVGVAATGRNLWVLNHGNSKLLRIDEQTGKLTHTTNLPGDAAAGPFLVGQTLWVAMTAQGIFHQIDTATGQIIGQPTHVPTGLCAWQSVVGTDIWATSMPFGDFDCANGTSRFDTNSGEVTPLASAEGKSLYTLAECAGSLWAADIHKTLYQVDQHTGTLRTVMTFDSKDANHLYAAYGSLWVTRPSAGQVIRLRPT